jgi:GNAT superfamily N-acetyltransferase
MPVAVQLETKRGRLNLHVCKDGSLENDDWIRIYEASFPPDQRQDVSEIKFCLQEGSMELDETRDETGDILCMTISEIFRPRHQHAPFVLACYTAVAPDFRGLGIGSVHRTSLDKLLQAEYSRYIGIVSEIESTKVSGLADDVMEVRVKRKRFFLKLGLEPLDVDYYFPSTIGGGEPIAGELLWVPFEKGATPGRDMLCDVLQRIYVDGYGLRVNDPFLARMFAQFDK